MEVSQDIKSRAEAFRREFLFGLTSATEVVAWADSVITAEEEPDISIIELAMAGNRGAAEIVHLLAAIPGEPSDGMVRHLVFCRMRDVLRAQPDRLRRLGSIFLSLASERFAPTEDAVNEMYALEDRLELARGGIFGDLEEIRRDTQAFLDRVTLPSPALESAERVGRFAPSRVRR